MKKIIGLFFALTLCSAQGATITFSLVNSVGNPDTNSFRIYTVTTPIDVNGTYWITSISPFLMQPDTNGNCQTNLMIGGYLATGKSFTNQFSPNSPGVIFLVTNNVGTYPMASLVVTNGYQFNWGGISLIGNILASDISGTAVTNAQLLSTSNALYLAVTNVVNNATNNFMGTATNIAGSLTNGFITLSGATNVANASALAATNAFATGELKTATNNALATATNSFYKSGDSLTFNSITANDITVGSVQATGGGSLLLHAAGFGIYLTDNPSTGTYWDSIYGGTMNFDGVVGTSSFGIHSDGSGNLTAASFIGDGSSLTGIPTLTGITNVVVGMTNGLATTNYVTNAVMTATNNALATATNSFDAAGAALAATNAFNSGELKTATNNFMVTATNIAGSLTNGFITLSGATNVASALTNGLVAVTNIGNAVAVTMTNGANQFTGTYIGNGNGLTNNSVTTWTVNSNVLVLDASLSGTHYLAFPTTNCAVTNVTGGVVGQACGGKISTYNTNAAAITNFITARDVIFMLSATNKQVIASGKSICISIFWDGYTNIVLSDFSQ